MFQYSGIEGTEIDRYFFGTRYAKEWKPFVSSNSNNPIYTSIYKPLPIVVDTWPQKSDGRYYNVLSDGTTIPTHKYIGLDNFRAGVKPELVPNNGNPYWISGGSYLPVEELTETERARLYSGLIEAESVNNRTKFKVFDVNKEVDSINVSVLKIDSKNIMNSGADNQFKALDFTISGDFAESRSHSGLKGGVSFSTVSDKLNLGNGVEIGGDLGKFGVSGSIGFNPTGHFGINYGIQGYGFDAYGKYSTQINDKIESDTTVMFALGVGNGKEVSYSEDENVGKASAGMYSTVYPGIVVGGKEDIKIKK